MNEFNACDGVWISVERLLALPTDGEAWKRLKKIAKDEDDWGKVELDRKPENPVNCLAGAIYAVRKRKKDVAKDVDKVLKKVSKLDVDKVDTLDASRSILAYVISADLLTRAFGGFKSKKKFDKWLKKSLREEAEDANNNRGDTIIDDALYCSNNWGTAARATTAAASVYLGDDDLLDKVAEAHRAWVGESTHSELEWKESGDDWHFPGHDNQIKKGINAASTTHPYTGLCAEEWRRFDEDVLPPRPDETFAEFKRRLHAIDKDDRENYPWSVIRGAVATGVILHRAGKVPLSAGNSALLRAVQQLYKLDYYHKAEDEMWTVYALDYYHDAGLVAEWQGPELDHGTLIDWTDYTHQK